MKYYSETGDLQYILHFPGLGYDSVKNIFGYERDRVFKKDERLTIISVMNKPIFEEANIVQQCKNSSISMVISDEAMNVPNGEWFQPKKIDYILECLDRTDTEFAIILDAKDTYIVNDLDAEFLKKFTDMDSDFCFNGVMNQFPAIDLEPIWVSLTSGSMKYLNGGVVLGYTEKLKEFYKLCQEIRDGDLEVKNTVSRKSGSEQFFLRLALNIYDGGSHLCKGVDSYRKLFSAVHSYDYNIYENNEGNMIVDCSKLFDTIKL